VSVFTGDTSGPAPGAQEARARERTVEQPVAGPATGTPGGGDPEPVTMDPQQPAGEPDVTRAPATGDDAVDEALHDLHLLLDQPLEAQVEGYTAVHGRLQDRLADLDG
jgi:hypothetical protein